VLVALGFSEAAARADSRRVIEMLERGDITPEDAERMLRGEERE